MLRFELGELLRGVAVEEGVVCGIDVGAGIGSGEIAQGVHGQAGVSHEVGDFGGDAHGMAGLAVPGEYGEGRWWGVEQGAEIVGMYAEAVDRPLNDV